MSHITRGILGGTAVALLLGAIQLASGSDMRATAAVPVTAIEASQINAEAVNRGGKSDRAQIATIQDGSRTVAFQLHGIRDTSLLVRISSPPAKVEKPVAASDVVNATTFKASSKRSAVACEPPVSVLTEVARLLEPGRCVT
ncbi:MAG: hypothetical protein H7316_02775 [Tardiphaga sp.]|uniref:hypothetical protein n=1 Tax=Tardiphaga sp. TaxID=1926292 RepID=UPI0019893573|nr:hypothetical protein [Tardiphaga sp.]MBC7582655.1 hypothetical protein [Tardiphaga sp.]